MSLEQASPENLGNRKSILVIDDSADILELQRIVLEMDGFQVFTALSGTEALELLAGLGPLSLILLDVQMEEMSGPEFLLTLEKIHPEIVDTVPVVFLTGHDEMPPGRGLGFIRKARSMEIFLAAVHRFIEMGRLAALASGLPESARRNEV